MFQSPKWLDRNLHRLDHLAAAFSPNIQLFNFTKGINATVNTHSEKLQLVGILNGHKVSFPNLPFWFNEGIDAKFDTSDQYQVDFGFVRKLMENIYILLWTNFL